MFIRLPGPHCLIPVASKYVLKLGRVYSPTLFTFSNIGFVIWGLLIVPLNVRMSLSISTKKAIGIWIGIALNLWIALGEYCHLNNIKSPVHKQKIRFHLFMSSLISFGSVL